ncbi:SDR family oxidoreductase [Agromyces aerolatus]|uniref:SDR family oxidoreductase n=1 Tax=Agromyces sp. LY-1074 TaxID=3074080 RepID=UPI0028624D51|nr:MULTISPECIES: SDR family oxidoreductase [unclassified Agromyces]MDR5698542.1 SDR family oxidoreductase [Agromyces sp. LY-1074]MDR5704836.1 SDR family oxidoreductase [Agromyces sp. LY-1358]
MTILVTAASGQLGRLVVEALLARGAQPSEIVATARDTAKLAELSARGIRTAELDYDRPETIAAALDGVDRVLLISGSAPGARLQGHRNVIDAAKAAGVAQLVYTSAPKATTAEGFPLAADHKATEEAIAAAGVPAVILRNNWYTENYVPDVSRAAETGVIASSAGDGRVASATRADFAEGAAAVLLDGRTLEGRTLELTGDTAWTFDDLAAAASEVVGREVTYQPLSTEEQVSALESAGLDHGTAAFVAGIDDAIRRGVLGDATPTLSELIGRPTTPLVEALRAAIDGERAAAA